ncbi:hypothetical protein [Deinococcus aestuarii]|uniref:hypothetical protein n=1 Tax=Deinococcus aestuarii TaxID=2774531 RepID=UPI001FE42021|nr:hypothetical protein [Deinococcus aestuarii]
MCPECEGLGVAVGLDLDRLLDRRRSLNGGAILHPDVKVGKWVWKTSAQSGFFDNDKPLEQYSEDELRTLLYGAGGQKVAFADFNLTSLGLAERLTQKDAASLSGRNRQVFEQFTTTRPCPLCHGARLNQAVLGSRIGGRNIAELSDLEVGDLIPFLNGRPLDQATRRVADGLTGRLAHMVDIGLGYLSLGRGTATLSGGESQRLKLIRHQGNSLTDMLYILDEPSVGLHARDVARLTGLLRQLRDKGNTVLVVEHDPDVIAIADHIVDLGPGAGTHGGEVVFEGGYEALRRADTLTGRFLSQHLPVKEHVRRPTGWMTVEHARLHNLKDVTVRIPTGVFTVVTGVAGSGKSTLINGVFLARHPDAVVIDQSRIGTNVRSTPATYTGIMDELRRAFAKANGVNASLFSFNSEGSCPNCGGLGMVYTDLAFMEGVTSPCEVCGGQRYRPEVLAYTLQGHQRCARPDRRGAARVGQVPLVQPALTVGYSPRLPGEGLDERTILASPLVVTVAASGRSKR